MKIFIFEELVNTLSPGHNSATILDFLDGERSIDKALIIATTNYPEKLDKRLVSRPRRFDRVIQIGMPSDEVRKMYFEKKLNVSAEEIDKWVLASDTFSFAACAELVISVCCFEKKFEEAVKDLKAMMAAVLSSRDYEFSTKNVGFAPIKQQR